VLIKYGKGFITALEVDEKFLDVEWRSLVLVNWEKGTSPSHFLRNPTFGVISTTEKLLQASDYRWRKKFLEFLV